MLIKTCKKCGQRKPAEEFPRNTVIADGRGNTCKACNRLASRNYALLARYGITSAEWDAMWTAQKGRCAICRKQFSANARSPHGATVDHCHKTGAVRALLHPRCNRALAAFLDSPEVCERAAAYLRGGLGLHPDLRPRTKNRWSTWFASCQGCGTADRPHMAKGLCARCYSRLRHRWDAAVQRAAQTSG